MIIGLTKKLQPDHVRAYKKSWEEKCANDILALSRTRFIFWYCIYKNPHRLLEGLQSLGSEERKSAVKRVSRHLAEEQSAKSAEVFFGINAVPQADDPTRNALQSVWNGELKPSYLGSYDPNPENSDFSTPNAMAAFHLYDLWCQVVGQTLAEARGTTPLEDLTKLTSEDVLDGFAGALVTFRLTIRGSGVKIPRMWKEHPTSSIQSVSTVDGRKVRIRMELRTANLFSDTAAINLQRGRVSGIGQLAGAFLNEENEMEFTVIPLLIGAGGSNLN